MPKRHAHTLAPTGILTGAILTNRSKTPSLKGHFFQRFEARADGESGLPPIPDVFAALPRTLETGHEPTPRYGASAVVPLGLSLSLIAVLIMLFTGWKGGELAFRHRVAVYDEPPPPRS
jgi:hypothetical protein